MEKRRIEPNVPEIEEEYQYILVAFLETGMVKQGFEGEAPLEWVDVSAYLQATQSLNPGPDAVTLFKMLRAYHVTRQNAIHNSLALPPDEEDHA